MPRTVFVWSCITFFTLVLGAMAFLTFPFDRRGNVVHLYARLWGWLILLANGVKVSIRGLENIDPKGPYIYICNHLGSFDIFALLAYLPVQFRWLAKVELFRIPVLGWAMSTAGYISLDRSERKRAYMSMKVAAQKIREGTSVVIFPEGSRSPDGTLQPFMKGGFTLAIKAGVPIIPITIDGTWEIMPRDTLRIKKGEIGIVIDRPIETTGLTMKHREKLMKEVEERIRANFPVLIREHRDAA
ncbi:MAG: 1-acyl-sn-glycerol-3-phosphate acyltransferase [Deltaproteobacteria bacterium]|nr:1-acyl-sn-glycerol-3-phosphate acyltransferase [Deltaproteobacteria bacterium]